MPNLKDINPTRSRTFALSVGSSGSGKTTASLSFAKCGRTYVFDWDDRIRGALRVPALRPLIEQGLIEYDFYPTSKESVDKALAKLEQFQSMGHSLPYRNIIWSTLTKFDDSAVKFVKTYLEKDGDTYGKIWVMGGFKTWGVQAGIHEDIINALKSLPCNVIVECHWTTKYKSEKVGMPKTLPDGMTLALRDKIAEMVPVEFNDVFFFEKHSTSIWDPKTLSNRQEVKYECVTDNELARTILPNVPARFDWTNKSFYETLMGFVETPSDNSTVVAK